MFHPHFHFFTGSFGITIGALCLIPYFLPTIVAAMRSHPNSGAIFAINFFLGWTFIAWVLCLIWAASDNSRYTRYTRYPPYNPAADSQDRIIRQLSELQYLRDNGTL